MVNIFGCADYPSEENWIRIYNRKKESLDKIYLQGKEGTESFNILSSKGIQEMELSFWLDEFNQKAFDLANSYVMLVHYYEKGIPDDEWFIKNKKGGYSFFPHFEEKHHAYFYWFTFYMDGYFTRFFSLIDTVYHLINIKYGFYIEPKLGFGRKVTGKLKISDNSLCTFLEKIRSDESYKKVEMFRNDLTHNYRPTQIDSGIKRVRKGDRVHISGGLGKYTTSREFITSIEDSIDLMGRMIDGIRESLISIG